METVFAALTRGIEGSPWMAVMGAFGWGVASILLSPCHLSSVPLIVGFINGQGRMTVGRATATAAVFASGILATIAGLGALTAAAGRMLGDVGPYGNYIVAGVFFLVGLHLLDVVNLPGLGSRRQAETRRGLWGALFLGLTFGVPLGPCTFAYLAPMLGITFAVSSSSIAYGIVLLLAFGVGHCSSIILAGATGGWVQQYLLWHGQTRRLVWLKRVCGVLVLLGGLYLLQTAR